MSELIAQDNERLVLLPNPHESDNKTTWMSTFHEAYFCSVVAQARCSWSKPVPDVHKIDIVAEHELIGLPIGFQLKSTIRSPDLIRDCNIRIDKPTHDVLRKPGRYLKFLCVLELPEEGAWSQMEESGQLLQHCLHWYDLKGHEEISTDRITIRIPRSQRLTPSWLCGQFESLARED
jgi:hypothetical protein